MTAAAWFWSLSYAALVSVPAHLIMTGHAWGWGLYAVGALWWWRGVHKYQKGR